ncbi:hypothetical protein FG386_002965 [Cryptosporidium ryanae]|uniref:uncharacterized protein n=1 Tax=Cryptosporidium ryanae TaxID=515981 RepID=UPI00351A0537|nr:hypothetical protein FG386_002965 [Cryptosporidium ryanae]
MSQYNYLVTAFRSNSIIGTLRVDLFGDGINRLLAIKTNCLEVYEIETSGINSFYEKNEEDTLDCSILRMVGRIEIYKSVLEFDIWRPRHQSFDDIALFTREFELIIIRAYLLESGNEKILHFHVMDSISLYRENLRKSQFVKMMVNAEKQRIIVLGYEGCLQLVGSEQNNKDGEFRTKFLSPVILRISESSVLDICLVTTSNERTLMAVIYDSGNCNDPRLMKVTELPIDIKKWTNSSNLGLVLEKNISRIIPFYDRAKENKVARGFFLFGDGIVEYKSLEEVIPNKLKDDEIIRTKAYYNSGRFNGMGIGKMHMSITGVIILENNTKWLVMDSMGRLLMMFISFEENKPNKIIGINVQIIKKYAPFSRIIQLESNLFFVSSTLSDSMVVLFKNNKLHILDIISNIGPIKDMFFTNNQTVNKTTKEKEYGGDTSENPISLISACGFGEYGTLKSICNGISLQNVYFKNNSSLNYYSKLFQIHENDYIIVTNVNETKCLKMDWNKDNSVSSKELIMKDESQINIELSTELNIINPEEKFVLSFEETELLGLESTEETIKILKFEDEYCFQVTQNGIFSIGNNDLNGKSWLLADYFKKRNKNGNIESEFIEKCDDCPVKNIFVMTTSSGFLLICKFNKNDIIKVISCFKREDVFKLIDCDSNNELGTNCVNSNEMKLLYDFSYGYTDEISILKILSIEKYTLVFVSTWMDGNKLFCLYFDNTSTNKLEGTELNFISYIETDFNDNVIITSLKTFILEKKMEHKNKKISIQKFICLLIGTNNGYLQLRYIKFDEILKNMCKKSNEAVDFNINIFSHQNTWKVSNIYISDIKEIYIQEGLNRYFFICSDQPKILFWSYNTGKLKQGLGIWSFYNVHSSWIQSICQVKLPFKLKENKELIKKVLSNNTNNYILYLNNEESDESTNNVMGLHTKENKCYSISKKIKQRSWLKLGLIDTFQGYNCRNIPLNFTPEKICYINDLKMHAVVGIIETYQKEGSNSNKFERNAQECSPEKSDDKFFEKPRIITAVLCLISCTDLEIKHIQLLGENVYPTCIEYIRLRATGDLEHAKPFLAVGTSKINGLDEETPNKRKKFDKNKHEPLGMIVLYEVKINDKKVVEVNEAAKYETTTSPFVINEFRRRILLVSVENTIICLELINTIPTNSTQPSSSGLDNLNKLLDTDTERISYSLKKRSHYSTHTMIVFIKIWNDELVLVGDLMKSVGLLEFDRNTGFFHEVCRDTSISWVIDGIFLEKNMYLISDENRNLRILMRNLNPINDETLTTMSCISHFHVGESVTKFQKGNFMNVYPETKNLQDNTDLFGYCVTENFCEDQIMFGTSQGGIYTVFSIKNSNIFFQLISIEEAIIETIKIGISQLELTGKIVNTKERNLRNLFIKNTNSPSFTGVSSVLGDNDSTPFRWKLNESSRSPYNFEYNCSGTPRGFVFGDVIESYLDLSIEMQKQVLAELKKIVSKKKSKVPETIQEMETIVEQLKNMHQK